MTIVFSTLRTPSRTWTTGESRRRNPGKNPIIISWKETQYLPDERSHMIKDQVALITGVSSGIGRETALMLAERGARVFGTVRHPLPGQNIAGVELIHLDVTDEAGVVGAVESILQKAGGIQVLVNNARYALA